jgi:glutathione S-transferase
MRLYMDPMATTCRAVTLFAADNGLAFERVEISLFKGEQRTPEFLAVNPDGVVPVLDDGGFRLTESSAILKYLADKIASPAYPTELQARARVNAAMDWFNTSFYREFGYGLIYARLRPDDAPPGTEAHFAPLVARRLAVLDGMLKAEHGPYVLGRDITLADYLGAAVVSLGELIDFDFSPHSAVSAWFETMRTRPSWDAVNAAFYGWRSALRAA